MVHHHIPLALQLSLALTAVVAERTALRIAGLPSVALRETATFGSQNRSVHRCQQGRNCQQHSEQTG